MDLNNYTNPPFTGLTNTHSHVIVGNMIEKPGTDGIWIDGYNSSSLYPGPGNILIADNYVQDHNWGNFTATQYGGIKIGYDNSGNILGRLTIRDNQIGLLDNTTPPSNTCYGILLGSNVQMNGLSIDGNTALVTAQGMSGVTGVLQNIFGGSGGTPWSETGTISMNAASYYNTTAYNPFGMPGLLVISGGLAVALSINGVVVNPGNAEGAFFLGPRMQFSLLYSGEPTLTFIPGG